MPNTNDYPGVIHADAVYEIREFMRRTGLSEESRRRLKARGLLRSVGRQSFILGRDFYQYLETQSGASQNAPESILRTH